MGGQVVVRLAIGVDVPLVEDPVLGFDRLAEEPASGPMRLEIILVTLDAGRELGGELVRVVAARAMSCSSRRLRYSSSRRWTSARDGLSACSARNWRARSIRSAVEVLGIDSERTRSSRNCRSWANRRVFSSCLRAWASFEASGRRVVSGNSRRKPSMAASAAAGSSMAASERASPSTSFQRRSCRTCS